LGYIHILLVPGVARDRNGRQRVWVANSEAGVLGHLVSGLGFRLKGLGNGLHLFWLRTVKREFSEYEENDLVIQSLAPGLGSRI
jgi:hypothetical protein